MIDESGWTQRDPISDEECILICLRNAPAGTDRKQVARLIQEYEKGAEIIRMLYSIVGMKPNDCY